MLKKLISMGLNKFLLIGIGLLVVVVIIFISALSSNQVSNEPVFNSYEQQLSEKDKQIDDLQNQIDEVKNQTPKTIYVQQPTKTEDPLIKIEMCKSIAEEQSESIAQQEFLDCHKDLKSSCSSITDFQCQEMMINTCLSIKKRNLESYYNQLYQSCLSK